MPFWNFHEITASGGSTRRITSVSCQLSSSICTVQLTRNTEPQHRSRMDQPMVSPRRWVSLVRRDMR